MPTTEEIRRLAARMIMPALDVARYHSEDSYNSELKKLVAELGVGGLIIFNGTISATREAVDELRSLSPHNLLVACDLEPGIRNRLLDGTSFPHAMAIAHSDPAVCADIAECIGLEARAAGITINFAPVCDINSNPLNPIINVRAFGETVETVSKYSSAFITGSHRAGVQAVVKHFPGHGNTTQDSHLTMPVVDSTLEEFQRIELAPFRSGLVDGADGVMVAHILVPAVDAEMPASLSERWVGQMLRRKMGFDGVVFTDALMMHAIGKRFSPEESAGLAVSAGVDVLVMPDDCKRAVDGIVEAAVANASVWDNMCSSERRIEAVASPRMPYPHSTHTAPASLALAKECARKALRISGKFHSLSDPGTSAILLMAGEQEWINRDFFISSIEKNAMAFRCDIYDYNKNINSLINQYDRLYFIMFSGVVSFQGDLGNKAQFQQALDKTKQVSTEIIGISLGNPYIWSELTNFTCSIDTYSNSQASMSALIELLAGEFAKS